MSRMLVSLAACAAPALGALATTGTPQFRGPPHAFLSEVAVNPPGGDNTLEYIEITGDPDLPMTGMFIVVLEGDGGGAGTIDQVVPLTGQIGTNGVYLLRDAALVLRPAPEAGTTVIVRDFQPDLENGSTTIIFGMATGDLPLPGTDLDTNNDGIIDVELPLQVLDAVSFQDGVTGGTQYAGGLGGVNLGGFTTFTPGMLYRLLDAHGRPHRWAGGVGMGASPGPFRLTPNASFGFNLTGIDPATFEFDPGRANDRLDTGACCFPDDTCTTLTRLECVASPGGGFWPGADCVTFVCPLITDYDPHDVREGEIVTIEGRELTAIADDASVIARVGASLVSFEVIEASSTQIRAVAGPIPASATPVQLVLHGGTGRRAAFHPALPEVIVENPLETLVWRAADQPPLLAPGDMTLVAGPDPPGATSYVGQLADNRVSLTLEDSWPLNTTVHIWLRLRVSQNAAPFFHDLTSTVRFRCESGPADAATRLADAIRSAFAQQTPPVMLTCAPIDLMDGRYELQIAVPSGTIQEAGLTVRAIPPDAQPLTPEGLAVTPFGAASLEPLNPGLIVRDLGPTGADGATIALPTGNRGGVLVEIDPIAIDVPGRCIRLDLWGAWNDMSCRRLVTASACAGTKGGGGAQLTADFAVGASTMIRVDVFQNDAQVGSVTLPSGVIGALAGLDDAPLPSLASWESLPARPVPGLSFDFTGPFSFTPQGGSSSLVGDSIRLLATTPGSPVQSIDLLDQSIANPTEAPGLDLVLRSAALLTACPCDFNLDQTITSQDFFGFIACFFTEGCREADHNADGTVNTQDFFDFLACFFGPPPECS